MIVVKNSNVHSKRIEGTLFLIDLDSDSMIELNEVGSCIWESFSQTETFDNIIKKITDEFEIEPERAKKDVHGFLKELKRCDLISFKEA